MTWLAALRDQLAGLWVQGAQESWLGAAAAALLVALLLWLLLRRLALRRTREILAAFNDSTRSALVPSERPRATRVRAAILPAPEPFTHLGMEFSLGGGGPLGVLSGMLLRRQRLVLHGALPGRPPAEIVWTAGRTPDRAVGRGPATRLWVAHQLPYGGGTYAVRGINTAHLEHAFTDLQTRFGELMRSSTIQVDAMPQMRVELAAGRLNREDVPALVATVRALGRAAMQA